MLEQQVDDGRLYLYGLRKDLVEFKKLTYNVNGPTHL